MGSLRIPRHVQHRLGFPIALLAAACTTAEQQPAAVDTASATQEPTSETTPSDVRGPDAPDATPQLAPQLAAPPTSSAHTCTSSERTPALDDQTTLGASPSEMLQWLGGEHHETLAWRDPSGDFTVDPAASRLEIVVEPPTAVRLLVSNSEDPSTGFCEQVIPSYGDRLTTFDELRFDVRLRASLPDSRLNVALNTTLRATASDYAAGWVELPLEAFSERLPADARAVFLRLGISPFGGAGQLVVSRASNDVNQDFIPQEKIFARFPADSDCRPGFVPFAAGDQPRGVSVATALERLNALDPLTLNDSPATLSWSFSATQGRGCAELGGPARIASLFSFPAHMSLHSSDGQIDGGSDVSISLTARAGAMGMPSVGAAVVLDDMTTAAATVRDFGIQAPLDFSGFDSALLRFSSESQADLVVGSLSVTGVNARSGATLYSVIWSQQRS